MIRLVAGVLFAIVVVSFVMMNLHPVGISLIFGPPLQVRLIYLLVTAFLVGLLSGTLIKLLQRARSRRRAHEVVD
jgi:uncharacterized integral membrane protein